MCSFCSPCGKKFRSKPQIARFLGDHADLSVFDFSRGAMSGPSSATHRRARDRPARRPYDGKCAPSLVKPLSNHPLGASGPIRRTCGVIKLPVLWVPEPTKQKVLDSSTTEGEPEPEPMDTSDSRSPVPVPPPSHSGMNGSVSPLPPDNPMEEKPAEAPERVSSSTPPPSQKSPSPIPPQASSSVADGGRDASKLSRSPSASLLSSSPPPFSSPLSSVSTTAASSSSQRTFPALWENRLRGYVVHDLVTKAEIKVDVERLRNGITHSNSNSSSASDKNASHHGSSKVENGSRTGTGDIKLLPSGAGGIQLPQTTLLNNLLGKQNVITSIGSQQQPGGSGSSISVVPSLLVHGMKPHLKQQGSVGGLVSTVTAAGGGGGVKYGSGGSLNKPVSSSSSLGSSQPNRTNITGGNLVLTLPTITQGAIKMIKQAAAASSRADMKQASGTTMVTGHKQFPRTSGVALTSGSSNKLLQKSAAESDQGLFVSKSELVQQEERVRRLREQLMAAQGAA